MRVGERAIVVGASISGLLAARALAEAYERVTVIERDSLPDGAEERRAVPQARHVHALLPAGEQALEELLPGIRDEIVAAGAPTYEAMRQMRFRFSGYDLARANTGLHGIVAGRPLFEAQIRDRVLALAEVELVERGDALGLVADATGERVTGVRVRRRETGSVDELHSADMVMAATGRSARVPAWLKELGYASPSTERLPVRIGYASRHLRIDPDALGPDRLILFGHRPGNPCTLALFAQEGERWLLTLAGYAGQHPPDDPEGFLAFAATVAPPDVMAALRDAEPLGPISTYGFAFSQRLRYERLARFPAGLLVTGDALCSFTPIYGQGMTVAALEAVALRGCLLEGEDDLRRRFFKSAARVIDDAWDMSMASDLTLPEVDGARPAQVRIVNAYLDRLLSFAERDTHLATAFARVMGMVASPRSLMRPRVVLRVLARSLRRPRTARRRAPVLQSASASEAQYQREPDVKAKPAPSGDDPTPNASRA